MDRTEMPSELRGGQWVQVPPESNHKLTALMLNSTLVLGIIRIVKRLVGSSHDTNFAAPSRLREDALSCGLTCPDETVPICRTEKTPIIEILMSQQIQEGGWGGVGVSNGSLPRGI